MYRYRGNTFIKGYQNQLIIRVGTKEFRFPEDKFSVSLLKQIIGKASNGMIVENFLKEFTDPKDKKNVVKHVYLLEKVGSILQVPDDWKPNKDDLYLFRNYLDFLEIPNKEMLNHYRNTDGNTYYLGPGIYSTSTYLENMIVRIKSYREFNVFSRVLKNKIRISEQIPYLDKLFSLYHKILSWDNNSVHPKFKNGFVLTSALDIKNFDLFIIDKKEHVTAEIKKDNFYEDYQITSSVINFLMNDPHFFLTYEVDKNESFMGNYSYRGYRGEKIYIEGESYHGFLKAIVSHVFDNHFLFKGTKINTITENAINSQRTYHKEFFERTGVLAVFNKELLSDELSC